MSSNEATVQSALKLLAGSLDPHIQKTLSPHLGGTLEWTDILHEMDKMKGKSPKIYSRSDVQCQLRIITERLGSLGYPFGDGDPYRLMSTYGNELRLIRNRWAHGDSFTALEAMRAIDTVYILLTHIGDHNAAAQAAETRTLIIKELISDSSDEPEPEPNESTDPKEESGNESPEESENPPKTPRERFSDIRSAFQSWDIIVTGDVETLENLPRKSAKESVRATIEEIVEFEAPIHRDRLTKLVGYTYGLGKVHEARAKKIAGQIKGTACLVDKDGFVWPADVNPAEWKIYRTSPLGASRAFTEISPVEIGNAMVDLLNRKGQTDMSELRRLTLRTFGRKKETKNFSLHLDKAVAHSITRGHIKYVKETDSLQPVSGL